MDGKQNGHKGSNQFTKAKRLGLDAPIVSKETRAKLASARSINSIKYWSDPENRKKQGEVAKKRGLGGVRPSRWVEYKGKMLGSAYELCVAKSLDANSIKWDTGKQYKFNYIDPFGKARTYTPDFYLPEYNVYLDPKNDFLIENINPTLKFKDTEKISRVCLQNNVNVLILNKNELNWEAIQSKISSLSILGDAPDL